MFQTTVYSTYTIRSYSGHELHQFNVLLNILFKTFTNQSLNYITYSYLTPNHITYAVNAQYLAINLKNQHSIYHMLNVLLVYL